ncbi:hypothetical protein ABQJ54_04900 [Rhodanobacter sp. Si-c]|uniref:Uncharacterized protein n=1 Tax=Rhodanobacter lycopersici TaxID=3162487 RepID=A0ABV3QB93_9GAMM
MDTAARKRADAWRKAVGLFAACVLLVLVSVDGLRNHLSSPLEPSLAAPAYDALVHRAEGGRELLRVTNAQDGSVRLYDARNGRPLSVASAD